MTLAAIRPLLGVLLGLLLAAPAAAQSDPVTISAKAAQSEAAPGDRFPIAVVIDHEPGWHTHTNAPKPPPGVKASDLWPTTIDAKTPPDMHVWPMQWPSSRTLPLDIFGTGKAEPYAVFDGQAVAFLPIEIPKTAQVGSTLTIPITVSYQTCDDHQCRLPTDGSDEVQIKIVAAGQPTRSIPDKDFAAFDSAVFSGPPSSAVASTTAAPASTPTASVADSAAQFDFFGFRFASSSLMLVLLVAALGGFILNLTPCVLPVVPLKVMALQNSAGQDPARRILLGISMCLGVIAFWFALGLLIVSLKVFQATNDLFGNPYFQLGVGIFIGAMAMGMLGAFTIQLPQSVYMLNPSHDSIHGSFAFGIVTAILGTPCFGPFAGAAAGWATTQPAAIGLGTFAAIGAGMGLPYLILAIWPGLLGFVPRTGPASELVKQVMGLLLFAAGMFFLGTGLMTLVAERPYLASVLHWWGVAAFATVAGVWLIYRTIQITRSPARRVIFTIIGLIIAGTSIGWANWQTNIARVNSEHADLWKPYSHESFESAIKSGKVVVLDFTADWCINCKAIEATVLNRDQVRAALGAPDVTAIRVDITSRAAPGRAKLAELHEVGIPLLAVFGPGLDTPWKSNAYSPAQVVEIIDRARQHQTAAATGTKAPALTQPDAPAR